MGNRTYHPRGITVDGVAVREHPLYLTWANMLSRCFDENQPGYVNYGGRGITVCQRWYHFANFVEDMGAKPSPELTIERIDNSQSYGPGNCKWDTRSNQCVNRRLFKNNSTGATGVVAVGDRFEARFDYEKVRYRLGRFDDVDSAESVRSAFEFLFFTDRPSAQLMIDHETVWCTSSTGVRGITPHKEGGFTVRVTRSGTRHYLGYFQTLDEAKDARDRFIAS